MLTRVIFLALDIYSYHSIYLGKCSEYSQICVCVYIYIYIYIGNACSHTLSLPSPSHMLASYEMNNKNENQLLQKAAAIPWFHRSQSLNISFIMLACSHHPSLSVVSFFIFFHYSVPRKWDHCIIYCPQPKLLI